MTAPAAPLRLVDPAHQEYAVKTWRYLRVAMVAIVGGLFIAVFTEHVKAHSACFLPSISDYYYTPVRGYFVAATLALGLCLVCLRGSTEAEDALLNIAGMLAPVVALVPTEYSTNGPHCASVTRVFDNTYANVANNVLALLIVGGVAIVAIVAKVSWKGATWATLVATSVAVALVAVAAALFASDPAFFDETAHFAAAVPMFACIAGAAVVNGRDAKDRGTRKRYLCIAGAMIVLPLLTAVVARAADPHHLLIWIETVILVLFSVFWVVQTHDLWTDGLRPTSRATREGKPRPKEAVPGLRPRWAKWRAIRASS